jgi:hypothetical protein
MDVSELINAFVEEVNGSSREAQAPRDIPPVLRDDPSDAVSTSWRIKRSDNIERITALQKTMGIEFPPSFRQFLSQYSFPAFEFGPILLFANTGQGLFWELEKRLIGDPHMSPALLAAGYIQIGNPYFFNYDPVCFAPGATSYERRIVQLDHEAILQSKAIHVVAEIAPSFVRFMMGALNRTDA